MGSGDPVSTLWLTLLGGSSGIYSHCEYFSNKNFRGSRTHLRAEVRRRLVRVELLVPTRIFGLGGGALGAAPGATSAAGRTAGSGCGLDAAHLQGGNHLRGKHLPA